MKFELDTQKQEEPEAPSFGRSLLNRVLIGIPEGKASLLHVAELPARAARTESWPDWVVPALLPVLRDRGVVQPWTHQAQAASYAAAGRHVIVSTGTASGKSLAYQMPVLTTLADDQSATAIYLAPTKALSADQLRSTLDLTEAAGLSEVYSAAYDGDTSADARSWVRDNARWLFTNPDMVHAGILGSHQRWGRLLRGLRYVVVDECHHYRGVFGAHVALVLRRLRRVAARYGADPVFVLASATLADPAATAERLVGLKVIAVSEDGSPRAARTVALWEPPVEQERPNIDKQSLTADRLSAEVVRRSAGAEAARIMAELVTAGARTLTFVASRRGAELTALAARRLLASRAAAGTAVPIAAYRAGYLSEDRRKLETALAEGELLGMATTNALESGIDIAGLDAVVLAGFPGTVASFWQQAGRAGRGSRGALVILVARDNPLDTYLVHHPAALLDKSVESTVFDPTNPVLLAPHLLCAATELPLTDVDIQEFAAADVVTELVRQGRMRKRPTGWFAVADPNPHAAVDIRGGSGSQVIIVEGATGRMLGTCDTARAPATVHSGAVYLHHGETYVVDELDLVAGMAMVRPANPGWTTTARDITDIVVSETLEQMDRGPIRAALAAVEVTNQVVGYQRTRLSGQRLGGVVALDLPVNRLATHAVMCTFTPQLLTAIGVTPERAAGALHAAEHAAIGLLPLFASCDRWDIGGLSTVCHSDTGLPTIFVYDGSPGGAGFAERGYRTLIRWFDATAATVTACGCAAGCPSCIQSPKCGNGNHPLDKAGAVAVLRAVVAELRQ